MCDVKPGDTGPQKPCSPEGKVKAKSGKEVRKAVAIKEPDCVEPVPPPVVDKVLFPVDTNDQVEQERLKCLEDCHVEPIYKILKACDRRVTRKLLYTAENCHAETVDLMRALDKCVRDKAFKRLA